MICKKVRYLLVLAIAGVLTLSCQQFDYPSEDELEIIEWNVTSVTSVGYDLSVYVNYIDTTDLKKDSSDEYFYDFDMTQPVKLSDLIFVDGKPLNQSYQIIEEHMYFDGGGEVSLTVSTPIDSNILPSISIDTSTIFYWKSDEIEEVMGSDIDPYIWAKVRFATESIEVTYY